jgi:hypothetical protein
MEGYIMAKKEILIPYEADGSIPWEHPWNPSQRYNPETGDYDPDPRYTWRKAAPFTARLKFHQLITVRSGATVRMKNVDTGAVYPMKLDLFTGLIGFMKYGELPVMDWEPYKVGSNYNIRRSTPG